MELSQTDTYLSISTFFISNNFMCSVELKLAKYQANAKQQPEAEFWLFQNYSHSLSTLSSKNIKTCFWNAKNKPVFLHEAARLIRMKMKVRMENRSSRYDINRPRSRHWYKYSKYKKRLSIIMLIRIKQQLCTIRRSFHENVKQHWN